MNFTIQKAGMGKRISAWMFDTVLFLCLATGILLAMSAIFRYDKYQDQWDNIRRQYGETYGVSLDLTEKEYNDLPDEKKSDYRAAAEAFEKDPEVNRLFRIILSMTVTMISLSLLLSHLILQFAVPLLLKNGRSLGKKIFGLALIRKDGVKVTAVQMFVRTVLGKYAVETMPAVLILVMLYFNLTGISGTFLILGLLVLQLCLLAATANRSLLHDLMAATVVVDFSSQMIFDTPEDMVAFKEAAAAEEARNARY